MLDFLFPKVLQVNAEDVKQAMDNHDSFTILDVRTSQEYAKSHLKNSINIPLDTIQNTIEKVFTDKSKTIYVYCLSGSRSVHAVEAMAKLGYSQVYNMTSGLLSWRAKGYPVG